jgi:gas vesicle protein
MSNDDRCNSGIVVLSFLTGAVVGAAVALLTTPKSGRETREILAGYGTELKEKAAHLPDEFRGYGETALDRGRDLIEKGKKLISKGTELAEHGKEFLDEKKQTLTEAIEAGRIAMAEEKEALSRKLREEE